MKDDATGRLISYPGDYKADVAQSARCVELLSASGELDAVRTRLERLKDKRWT